MAGGEIASRVEDVLAVDAASFDDAVAAEAAEIKELLDRGAFDNPQAIVGFEYEFYAVDETSSALRRVPRRMLELIGFEKELGLHNAEMSTSPQPLNAPGLRAQEAEVRSRLSAALDVTRTEGMRLVSDGVWTVPPAGESARSYLTDSVTDGGVRIATNMSDAARYHAMANGARENYSARMTLSVPHATLAADTVLPESLITSIQPHYQVPHAADLPAYFTYAVRAAAPLLALGVNSPFLPPDLYDDDATADAVLADAEMEHRIHIFESVMNADGSDPKVRFPRDLADAEEAIDRVVADETIVPMPVDPGDRFDDRFAHFRLKHGTFWRWVRPVFDGPTRSAANARIEFRPVATQPTVRDSIAFQAAFAGLMESLPRLEHPVAELDWERARENFYAATSDGLEADLVWITNAGETTRDREVVFDDLLDHAADGLQARGLSNDEAARYLWPLRQRARHGISPARWKVRRVESALSDGADLAAAIHGMQRRYVDRQRETLLDGSFADWLDDR